MDFKDEIKQIADKIEMQKDQIQTEEATKNAFILPFIKALGYDIFNPFEVIPEYVCDIGTKKGEKIDYAILKENKPIILIECKHWKSELNLYESQLLRYFHVSKAKFGILTSGIIYRFYTDLKEPNKMDEKPFFEINLTDIRENQIEELKKFHKSYFDIDNILSTASELQYTNELKNMIHNEIINPSEPMVRLLAKNIYSKPLTSKIIEQFTELVKKSVNAVISDIITERLKTVLIKEKEAETDKKKEEKDNIIKDDGINTTIEEIEAFYIVKAIVSKRVALSRITYKDTKSYFVIMLDDKIQKPICRLEIGKNTIILKTFDEDKYGKRHKLNSLEQIYDYSKRLLDTVDKYESSNNKK
ncbi:MAG: restriction endonuclease [Candidatus Cloacimonetes bacterium]|nr:restriction endonuclease [Candidatus Cloacimonadota bacterium]